MFCVVLWFWAELYLKYFLSRGTNWSIQMEMLEPQGIHIPRVTNAAPFMESCQVSVLVWEATCEALSHKDEAQGWIGMVYSVSFMMLLQMIHRIKTWILYLKKQTWSNVKFKDKMFIIQPAHRPLTSKHNNKEPVCMFVWQHLFKLLVSFLRSNSCWDVVVISEFD